MIERHPKDNEKILSNKIDLLDIHLFHLSKTTSPAREERNLRVFLPRVAELL